MQCVAVCNILPLILTLVPITSYRFGITWVVRVFRALLKLHFDTPVYAKDSTLINTGTSVCQEVKNKKLQMCVTHF